jgi:D-tyrosyl-tRNA(Tyr) deacylase
MRAVIQRVSAASVTVDGSVVGQIGAGLAVLVGVTHDDTEAAASKLADKVWNLRIFEDSDGAMNLSCADLGHDVLVISQFTVYGDASRGRRPSFVAAARPEFAEPLIERVVSSLRERGATVETGRFGADMAVEFHNDGPVTLVVEV